jgi:hypothetical protein
MSRSRTRSRKRRARQVDARAEFARKRDDPVALSALVSRMAESDECVWPIARSAAGDRPLDDDEKAMIAQIVAPHLAGKKAPLDAKIDRILPKGVRRP